MPSKTKAKVKPQAKPTSPRKSSQRPPAGLRSRNLHVPAELVPAAGDIPEAKTLSVDEQLFVSYLLEGIDGQGKRAFNSTEAARRLGYADPEQRGCDMMRKPGVKAAIAARMNQHAMSVAELLIRTTEIARGDMGDFWSKNTEGRWFLDLDKAKRLGKFHLIRKLEFTRYGPKIELYSAEAAQDRLTQIHGLKHQKISVYHKIDLSLVPNTDRGLNFLSRLSSLSLDPEEALREYRQLVEDPSPAVIDGEGLIHEVSDLDSDSELETDLAEADD